MNFQTAQLVFDLVMFCIGVYLLYSIKGIVKDVSDIYFEQYTFGGKIITYEDLQKYTKHDKNRIEILEFILDNYELYSKIKDTYININHKDVSQADLIRLCKDELFKIKLQED